MGEEEEIWGEGSKSGKVMVMVVGGRVVLLVDSLPY